MVASVLLVLAAAPGAEDPPVAPPPRAAGERPVTVRFLLPVERAERSSAGWWGVAAPVVDGFSDPNLIAYDDDYVRQYLRGVADSPTRCGSAPYTVETPDGAVEFAAGLDYAYLGRKFRANDLVLFLKTRAEVKREEREFRVVDPEVARIVPGHPGSRSGARPLWSPWDRDTVTVVALVSNAGYKPAYPHLKALLKDPSLDVRGAAVFGLGRLAPAVPEVIDDLSALLPDEELGGPAADALRAAGKAAVPALVKAMDSPSGLVQNRAVFALARMEFADAVPGLLAALGHKDKWVRSWAASVVVDMRGRGVKITDDRVAAAAERVRAERDR